MKNKLLNLFFIILLLVILIFIGILISDNLLIHQLINQCQEFNTKLLEELGNFESIEKKYQVDIENNAVQQIKTLEKNQEEIKKIITPNTNYATEWVLLLSISAIGLYVVITLSFGQ